LILEKQATQVFWHLARRIAMSPDAKSVAAEGAEDKKGLSNCGANGATGATRRNWRNSAQQAQLGAIGATRRKWRNEA